jgi:hypothetical protein
MILGNKIRRNLTVATACAVAAIIQIAAMTGPAKAAPGQRVDLRVLVVSSGDTGTQAIMQELTTEGVPFTQVDLNNSAHPTINAAFLSDTVNNVPRAKFQSVVLANENPFSDTAQLAALHTYEQTFGIRQVDASTWANPNVGLNYAQNPGYIGAMDGITATANPAGAGGAFSYLVGPVPFDVGSWGYLATPASSAFTPVVTATIPGTSTQGSVVGVYATPDAREELVITTNYNFVQNQFRLLAHGIITWMTRGVHLGYNRNYFAVTLDDLFLADSRWSTSGHCTPGDDCPPGSNITTTDIRMTSADVTNLVNWQNANNFKLSFAFNGFGHDDWLNNNATDPLFDSISANKANFYFIDHTYSHEFLGCQQDFTVVPWRCVTNSSGVIQWVPGATINQQIDDNITFANENAIPINATELVTGEHSGLKTLPQQPNDNPNLAPQLTNLGIKTIASDDSREHAQRTVGSALTLPRHPMNIFYNVAKKSEEISEYNWIYTSKANGGSGICENNPTSTCITPLGSTGFDSYIVPTEITIDMQHILANDPRPHYMHQSNIAEERIAYPVLNGILTKYKSEFAANAPIVNPTMTQGSTQLNNMAKYNADLAAGRITAYTLNDQLFVTTTAGSSVVPITVPNSGTLASNNGAFGEQYGNERSGWVTITSATGSTINPSGSTTTSSSSTTSSSTTATTQATTSTTAATTTSTTQATTTTTRATTTTTRCRRFRRC